jgi:hypothetical protein
MARGANLKWIQAQGGWARAKVLLDCYGHFLPTETNGYADALADGPARLQSSPGLPRVRGPGTVGPKTRAPTRPPLAPRGGIEPPTRCLEGSRSIH